jgi:hypothetical protein
VLEVDEDNDKVDNDKEIDNNKEVHNDKEDKDKEGDNDEDSNNDEDSDNDEDSNGKETPQKVQIKTYEFGPSLVTLPVEIIEKRRIMRKYKRV